MRRRDPPPPQAVCVRCGWSGTPNHTMLRDDYGDVSLIVSQKPCPQCGAQAVQLHEEKPSLAVEMVTAIRTADFNAEELADLARALAQADPNTTPRQLAEDAQVPRASSLISIASKAGPAWIALLAVVVALAAMYVAHADAAQAHRDAEQAHRDAVRALNLAHADAERELRESRDRPQTTGGLSQQQIDQIADAVVHHLERNP